MKKYSNGNTESQVPNIISVGTKITGDIESNGDVRIDGSLSGKINAKGKVVVGKEGIVDGEIHCKNVDISGKVSANIMVKELTVFKTSAVFKGEITTTKISIESGALFTGSCKMAGIETTAKIKNEGKKG